MSDVTTPRERARPEMSGPVLGMVLFVASEAMFFAAFFGGYFTIRANAPAWPPPQFNRSGAVCSFSCCTAI